MDTPVILIAGGDKDPNLLRLIEVADQLRVDYVPLLVGADTPAVSWDLDTKSLFLNGGSYKPSGVFARYDVFAAREGDSPNVLSRSQRWFNLATSYGMANSEVRMLNKHISTTAGYKAAVLCLAQRLGLKIPRSLVSNRPKRLDVFADHDELVVKPLNGGGFCRSLSDSIRGVDLRSQLSATPAIVQKRLEQPEVRIYRIGQKTFAFDMKSDSLDYRVKQDANVSLRKSVPQYESLRLKDLMDMLEMDFGAADFKTDPVTGNLCFLEVNTSPMFAAFDEVSGGKLSEAILNALSCKTTDTISC